jgi:hypothetical protein
MALPDGFQFSQNSLQDYVECERRFQLRYLIRQHWPAVASEPIEELEHLLELGRRFHRLAEQHNLGMPESELSRSIDSDRLRRWWRNYLENPPPGLPPGQSYAETTLSTPIQRFRLLAKYDLLSIGSDDTAVVVDWKTTRRRPNSAVLAKRLQTRIYCYVAVKAAHSLSQGTRIQPGNLTMVYWFSEFPHQPEVLRYSDAQHERNDVELNSLVAAIAAQAEEPLEAWPLTNEIGRCRFCNYRSLCNRGVVPGPVAEWDADAALDLDTEFEFEDIEEIAY